MKRLAAIIISNVSVKLSKIALKLVQKRKQNKRIQVIYNHKTNRLLVSEEIPDYILESLIQELDLPSDVEVVWPN